MKLKLLWLGFALWIATPNIQAGEMEFYTLYPYPSAIYNSINATNTFDVSSDVLWPAATNSVVLAHGNWNIKNNLVAGGVGGKVYANGLTVAMEGAAAANFGLYFLPTIETTRTTHNFPADTDATLVWGMIRNSTWHTAMKPMLNIVGTTEATTLWGRSSSGFTNAEVNCTIPDSTNSRNGLAGVAGTPGIDLRHTKLLLDGNPIMFATLSRQVVVNGDALPGEPNTVLIIGRAADGTAAYASAWNVIASSRALKTDIVPLGFQGYTSALQDLQKTDIISFRYKNDPAAHERIGFVAEKAPEAIVNSARDAVSVTDEVGWLMAAAKGLRIEQKGVAERIAKLEKEATR